MPWGAVAGWLPWRLNWIPIAAFSVGLWVDFSPVDPDPQLYASTSHAIGPRAHGKAVLSRIPPLMFNSHH